MHITKLFSLWILIFSAAFILDTKEETTKDGTTLERTAQYKTHFTNGRPLSGLLCGKFCSKLVANRMEKGLILPKIINGNYDSLNKEKEEKANVKKAERQKETEFLILDKRSIGSQQSLDESGRRHYNQQRNTIEQRYSPSNRGYSQNGPYNHQNRFSPQRQSYQNNRATQGGKYQNTGFTQNGRSPYSARFPQGGKSSRNTGYPQKKTYNNNSRFPDFRNGDETYRSDYKSSFVPSANIIPHDMLILSEHNRSGQVEGGILVEGDIILPRNSDQFDINHPRLWENGQIHYEMDDSVDFNLRKLIWEAMNEWENSSCIRFVDGCRYRHQCVRITTQTNLCSSLIGSAPFGQDLKLAANCHTLKIVRHELGHVIGFYHEQSRYDRDKYIHINKENLMPNTDTEFNKYMDTWGAEYDYSSVMQYDAKSFSNDRVNKNTMVTPNPHYQTLMGNSKGLSFRDKYRVNKMYSCSAYCPNRNDQCLNGGYLSVYKGDGQPCQCICPPRITGPKCENKPKNYEYYDVPKCSMNVTEPTILETPGYPHRGDPPEKCSYWIQAPKGRKVLVSFQDFSFADRGNGLEGPDKCYYEKVEIRKQNPYSGEMYCAEDLKGRTFTSITENFIMIIDSEDNTRGMRGLKAIVTFV